jgi:hypothetical protein
MQQQLEALLARLLTDRELCERFLADPVAVAGEHGLSPDESRSVATMSAQDLTTAARSFKNKRNAKQKRGNSWLNRLLRRSA